MIRLENISKIYDAKIDTTKALDNVSLQINDGELVAIMGPSGSGKSTLLNIIGCMDTATEGKYYVDDVEVSLLKKSQRDSFRKKNIGFVFQHFALMDYYTAYENIELPLIANNVRKSERKKIVQQQLEHLGITSQRNKLPKKMSGGQQQRVAIARALVTNVDIILADEPTGALDQKTGQEVLALLKEINSTGKTVIIVTHDEKIAADCNRVIMIQDGRIRDDKKIVS
jgi:putative ABC transport system ATP-binding protein